MTLTDRERSLYILRCRYRMTCDALLYEEDLRRIVEGLMVWGEDQRWTARGLAETLYLATPENPPPYTTVRRRLNFLIHNGIVDKTKDGYAHTPAGKDWNARFQRIVTAYIRGGIPFDRKLLLELEQNPDGPRMALEWLRNHIWRPVIDVPEG